MSVLSKINAVKKWREEFKDSDNSIVSMIKVVTLVSIVALVITSIIIAVFNNIQHNEREQFTKEQSQLTQSVNKINSLVQESEQYFLNITVNHNSKANDQWYKQLHEELLTLTQQTSNDKIKSIASNMKSIDGLKAINHSKEWLDEYIRISADIENKTTLKRIYNHIDTLQNNISLLEGQYNLEIARFRRAFRKKNIVITEDLSNNFIHFTYATRQIGSFKTALNNLKQNIDNLALEYKKDNLPNIRENKILPAFVTLNRIIDNRKKTNIDVATFKVTLQLLGQELFGNNFNLFQMMEREKKLDGGFYHTKTKYLHLKEQNKNLQLEISILVGQYKKAVLEITQNASEFLNQGMHNMGDSLTTIQRTILILSALFSLGLFLLGRRVLDRVNLQLNTIVSGRKRMGQILHNMWDGLIIVDNSENVIQTNPAAQRIFDKEVVTGTPVGELIPELEIYNIKEMYKSDVPFEMSSAFMDNGDSIPLELTVSLIDSDNEDEYAIFIRDISGTKRLDEAKKASELKSSFLANMSHEIRTPMNGVIGTTQLLERTNLNKQQQKYVSRINSSSYTLLGIINDILDFSKIESGKLTIEKININLDDILSRVADVNAVKAEEKKVEFIYSIAKDVPRKLVGDGIRITQVITNLASNAIKFTQEGEIVLNITVEAKKNNEVELLFTLRDTGIGMTEEQLGKLFQDFVQADSSTTRKFGGTGLGLSICKKLVELMDGEIGAKSSEGVGSTFWFKLPFIVQETQSDTRVNNFKDMHVLIVDDNETALLSLKEQLEMFNVNVDTANNGQIAIKKIQTMQQLEPYELVFIDWDMPGLNGIETIKKVKEIETIKVKPKFVMVTAYGKEEIKEADNCELLNAFLNKPTTPSLVYETMADIFQDDQAINFNNTHTNMTDNDLAGINVLLVEDNIINQEVAIELLEDRNMIVTLAENGEESIEKAAKQNFDLILMDMQMPIMDGIQATKILRSQKRYDDVPIIALTANAMADDVQKCKDAGMNDHLSKPINVNALYTVIKKWTNPISSNIKVQTITETHQEITMEDGSSLPDIDGINFDVALSRINGKKSLLIKMLKKFYQHQGSSMDDIQVAWDKQEYDNAVLVAHSLKGVSGNIGADLLHIDAAELEKIIKDRDMENFVDSFNKTQKSFDMIMNDLAKVFGNDEKQQERHMNLDLPANIDKDTLFQQLDKLHDLLSEDERDSITLSKELETQFSFIKQFEQFNHLQEEIESYSFDEAIEILASLKEAINKELT